MRDYSLVDRGNAELHPDKLQGTLDPFSQECKFEDGVKLWLNELQ